MATTPEDRSLLELPAAGGSKTVGGKENQQESGSKQQVRLVVASPAGRVAAAGGSLAHPTTALLPADDHAQAAAAAKQQQPPPPPPKAKTPDELGHDLYDAVLKDKRELVASLLEQGAPIGFINPKARFCYSHACHSRLHISPCCSLLCFVAALASSR